MFLSKPFKLPLLLSLLGVLSCASQPKLAERGPAAEADPARRQSDPLDPAGYYQALELPVTATADEIRSAHRRLARKFHMDSAGNADGFAEFNRVCEAYDALGPKGDRAGYDAKARSGETWKPRPGSSYKELPTTPEGWGQFFKREGQSTFKDVMSFYLAIAIVETAQCLYKNDPTACKRYVESLNPTTWDGVVGHGSFLSFVFAQRLTASGIIKFFGTGPKAQFFARNVGLTAGALVQEVAADFLTHPETMKILASKSNAERWEHTQLLWDQTFGDRLWNEYKGPTIVSLIAASYLADASTFAATKAVNSKAMARAYQMMRSARTYFPGGDCAKSITPFIGKAAAEAVPRWSWTKRMGHTIGFLLWANALHGQVDPIYYGVRGDPEASVLNNLLAQFAAKIQSKAPPSEIMALGMQVQLTFDRYRARVLRLAAGTRGAYAAELSDLENSMSRTDLMYLWLTGSAGAQDTENWPFIQQQYFPNAKSTADKEVRAELDKMTRAFFCGTDPSNAYSPARDFRGIPDPTRWTSNMKSYKAVQGFEDMCDKPLDERLAFFKEHKILMAMDLNPDVAKKLDKTSTKLSVEAQDSGREFIAALRRETTKFVDDYEREVQQNLIDAMESPKAHFQTLRVPMMGTSQLNLAWRDSVKDILRAETELWQAWLSQPLTDRAVHKFVYERWDQTAQKTIEADVLLKFAKSPPDERTPGEPFLVPQLPGLEWTETLRDFRSYNLRQ